MRILLDGVACEGTLAGTAPEQRDDRAYVRAHLEYECAGSPSGAYTVRYGVFTDADAVVDDHTSVTDYRLGDASGTFVFDAGHRELDAGDAGLLSSTRQFVALGVEHILAGIDHVLFLLVLLLGARSFRSVIELATTFTVAHSITLALAALGWVHVPAAVVEPLIALSIAYVAVENVLGGESRHRLAVVFGFGLLHGLGFASTLSFTDQMSWQLLASLLSFNVGIELGQALIVAVAFPLLLAVRRLSLLGRRPRGCGGGRGDLRPHVVPRTARGMNDATRSRGMGTADSIFGGRLRGDRLALGTDRGDGGTRRRGVREGAAAGDRRGGRPAAGAGHRRDLRRPQPQRRARRG